CISAHAQLAQPTPSESGLSLEVVFLKGTPPAYQPIRGSEKKPGWSWYARFGRIAGWQTPQGALPVNAVKLAPSVKGEVVSLRVSVLRGQFLDVEDRVGSYKLREGEAITVTELQTFGVEPYVAKVVRVSATTDVPNTSNQTKSVAVVGLEPFVAPLPRYKLTLHHLSDKSIVALSINIMGEGRVRKSGLAQGEFGEPLIKARDSQAFNESLAVTADGGTNGFQPLSPADQQILIQTLVFDDGSYEGQLKPAAMFLGFVAGRRTEIRRVLPLLDDALLAPVGAAGLDSLRSRISSLNYEPDEAEVGSLEAAFPTLDKAELRASVEIAIHGVRRDLLRQLERLQRSEMNAK